MDYKKPSDAELRQRLTPMQYQVTQKEATRAALSEPSTGTITRRESTSDAVSESRSSAHSTQVRLGHRLAQLHQAAGAGEHSNQDRPASFIARTEVRSAHADSHLGHSLTTARLRPGSDSA